MFPNTQISTLPQTVYRNDASFNITVSDTRTGNLQWSLYASLSGGAMLSQNDALYNALVIANNAGEVIQLTSAQSKVFTATTGASPLTTVSWAADKGPLLMLRGGQGMAGETYEGTIEWTLVDGP
jgi:hypothetical protein